MISQLSVLETTIVTKQSSQHPLPCWSQITRPPPPIFKGYKLEGHLIGETACPEKFLMNGRETSTITNRDGKTPEASSSSASIVINPAFEQWITTDLLLLEWFYNSMTPGMAIQLMVLQMPKICGRRFKISLGFNPELKKIFFPSLISQVLLDLDDVYDLVITMIQGSIEINPKITTINNSMEKIRTTSMDSVEDQTMVEAMVRDVVINQHAKFVDKATRDILLKGTLKDGFYHLESVSRKKGVAPVYSNITNQQFMHKNKDISTFVLTGGTNPVKINVDVSKAVWHRRLEYPLSKILNSILKGCNLIVNDNNGKTKFCDYCQFGKSHNLPFPNS
ncbi:Retrovirus-related Pol polyprotein from transposon TNT 1-94 [Cucumis melo var. makuwa]|uniref:Retrovirus-related Pol polyprotein from transposon TNT 1-94 n=1 Tax=Cucumis melo var. makuwa TaxID=1194695 RepID=A0A5D3D5P2_CUCMM|nr:Retrovirus-related Pol polyprotein from transposon TNT 1-94 [Cucumis melo var. makuwa]